MSQTQEQFIRTHAADLREKIAVGLKQVRRGEMVDGKTAIHNLREKLRRRGRDLLSLFSQS